MNLSDNQIAWFEYIAGQYSDDIDEGISSGEIVGEDIEVAKLEVETFNEIKKHLNDKNINIYKIGIMKMRGILKDIYKIN